MLFLRLDQALELLCVCQYRVDHARTNHTKQEALKEMLAIRYFMLNGLSPMEVSQGRIEHMDPVECTLFLSRVHWKTNQIKDVDPETVRLQIIYSKDRKKGPLLRSRMTKGHMTEWALWALVQRVAKSTNIVDKEKVGPLVLKRTFARLFLKTPGNTVGTLQKAFCHKHLWSTAHYLRFFLDDVKEEKARMIRRIESAKAKSVRQVP